MATVGEHRCNPRKYTQEEIPGIFRNDANSVSKLQRARLQKQMAEDVARLQQEKLDAANEDIKTIRDERDTLRKAIEGLQSEKRQKETELATAISQKQAAEALSNQTAAELSTANAEKSNYSDQVKSLSTTVEKQSVQIQTLSSQVKIMENMLPNTRQDNSLPFQYHNSTVMIVNLGSQRALDAGREEGVLAHGWDYDLSNGNQIFTLSKVYNAPNRDDCWVIARKNDGKRLFFRKRHIGLELQVGNIAGRAEFWYIGRGSDSRVGSWVIKNAQWGTYVELESSSRSNGTRILSNDFSDHENANWVIIPTAFAS